MIEFYKYHGAGNDFIVVDDHKKAFDIKDVEKVKMLCHRHFGIGADGILLVREKEGYDFEMVYANSDGSMGAMCGNGARCIVHFAYTILGIIKDPKKVRFLAADGDHEAEILENGRIKLKMQDVSEIGTRNNFTFLRSGTTPHNVIFVENLEGFPVVGEGKKIQKSDPDGVNVNFVEVRGEICNVRTYERGVENETMACGTGATSVAIAAHNLGKITGNVCKIKMPGGDLTVEFEKINDGSYQNIWLIGPAKCVFKGELQL